MHDETIKNESVFVYGTLRQNGSNAWRMGKAKFVELATTLGHLYRVDWYPGAIFDQTTGTTLVGELYAVPEDVLLQLDDFEGQEYERVKIVVSTRTSQQFECWAWQYRLATKSLTKIPSGDWLTI